MHPRISYHLQEYEEFLVVYHFNYLRFKLASSLRVDFHCRVIFKCVYTNVNLNYVNKREARYKVLSLNVKLSEVEILRLRATFHALPLFCFANVNFTHVCT